MLRMDARGPLTFSRQRSKVLGLRHGPGVIVPAHLLQFRQRTSAPRVFEMGWREFMRGRRGGDKRRRSPHLLIDCAWSVRYKK